MDVPITITAECVNEEIMEITDIYNWQSALGRLLVAAVVTGKKPFLKIKDNNLNEAQKMALETILGEYNVGLILPGECQSHIVTKRRVSPNVDTLDQEIDVPLETFRRFNI